MSAVAQSVPVLDPLAHAYSLDGKPLLSVSKVINALVKKSFDGVDEAILENARTRGILVEQYATEWMQTGGTVNVSKREDVDARLECFERWMNAAKPTLIETQKLVWCSANGTAGMLDFIMDIDGKRWIVDMKCTAQPEATWMLQVGGYGGMEEAPFDGLAVLHINPKYAKGYIWREYDRERAIASWWDAVAWYKVLQLLKAEAA